MNLEERVHIELFSDFYRKSCLRLSLFEDFKDGTTPNSAILSNLLNFSRVVTKMLEKLPDARFFFSSTE